MASTPATHFSARIAGTWQSILERVPDYLLDDERDLPTLLETRCGKFETFHMCPREMCEDQLDRVVENDQLVKEILQCMDEAYQTPQSLAQSLLSYTLAPSASQNMDEEALLSITGTILLGKPFPLESDFRKFIDSKNTIGSAGEVATTTVESSQGSVSKTDSKLYTESERLLASYKQHEKNAVGLRRKEVSGIPLLGNFLACVVEILNEKQAVARYLYELEFTVMKNPATDGAVIVVIHDSSPSHPVIIYEYKAVVDPEMSVVDKKDLAQLLIQGFYCFRQYKIDECVLCLTDMYRFHYMKVTNAVRTMAIKWVKSISFEEEKQMQKQMQEHFSFIAAAI